MFYFDIATSEGNSFVGMVKCLLLCVVGDDSAPTLFGVGAELMVS